MEYLLNIEPEKLLKEKFYIDFGDEETVCYFKEEKSVFDSKAYVLNFEDKFVFSFNEMKYGWELYFKTMRLGTNSDNYYFGGVAINFLGQMIERKIIIFDSKVRH